MVGAGPEFDYAGSCRARLAESGKVKAVNFQRRTGGAREGSPLIGAGRADGEDHRFGFRIGVISDTHGLLRPEAIERLKGAHHIIHAGDIGNPAIIETLGTIAPTSAIRGNIDKAAWAAVFPETRTLRLAGLTIRVLHNLSDLDPAILSTGADVVISGHSHRPSAATRDGVLFLNPGSAGSRRFRLPVTLASLEIGANGVRPQIHHLLT